VGSIACVGTTMSSASFVCAKVGEKGGRLGRMRSPQAACVANVVLSAQWSLLIHFPTQSDPPYVGISTVRAQFKEVNFVVLATTHSRMAPLLGAVDRNDLTHIHAVPHSQSSLGQKAMPGTRIPISPPEEPVLHKVDAVVPTNVLTSLVCPAPLIRPLSLSLSLSLHPPSPTLPTLHAHVYTLQHVQRQRIASCDRRVTVA
jgi:hypothetical protein